MPKTISQARFDAARSELTECNQALESRMDAGDFWGNEGLIERYYDALTVIDEFRAQQANLLLGMLGLQADI